MDGATIVWQVTSHVTKFGEHSAGFHCSVCGKFYDVADYTIDGIDTETGLTYTLCYSTEVHHCRVQQPSPVTFFNSTTAQLYLTKIVRNWVKDGLVPVRSINIQLAYFRQDHVY